MKAQIMPLAAVIPNRTVRSTKPMVLPVKFNHGAVKLRRRRVAVVVRASMCFDMDKGAFMKGGFGATAAVTLEKSKLDTTTPQTEKESQYTRELSNNGGNGDGKGGGIGNGKDGGGDGNGDDDDYFNRSDDFDDGNNDWLFRTRIILEELFDRKFVDAVLNEWQKTVTGLPPGLRQAVEMGLVSSAQMVRFMAVNSRPTIARNISRKLPEGVSRAFIGRMIADPAFLYKLLLDQAATMWFSVWGEVNNRQQRLKQEWYLALLNVLTKSACSAFVVWSLAPCRSYGNTFQYDFQNTLQKLPNNIFEKSYPLREFDIQRRIQSFAYKAAELATVGLAAEGIRGALSNILAGKKDGWLSGVGTSAFHHGAFLGLCANLQYQMLCGIDRWLINHFDVIGVALFFSTTLRIMNMQLGEISRLPWLNVEGDHSDDSLRTYNKLTVKEADSTPSSNPFVSKIAVVKRLGLLGIGKQENKMAANGEAPIHKPRRKRVARKVILRSA